jgi:hypothetical protein
MRLPTSQELIALAKDGAIAAFNVDIDEIFWASETTDDNARHVAIYMSIPDKVALLDDKVASFFCVAGETMIFIPVKGQKFSMQETEVTRRQWKALMGLYPEDNLPSWQKKDCDPRVKSDDHPVTCITMHDANEFADKMTRKNDGYVYALPSEEAWVTAARAITNGDDTLSTFDYGTHPVKQGKAHNGLYDLDGNVWEWTSSETPYSSLYGRYYIVRGGCSRYNAKDCSTSERADVFWIGRPNVGFRLMRIKLSDLYSNDSSSTGVTP